MLAALVPPAERGEVLGRSGFDVPRLLAILDGDPGQGGDAPDAARALDDYIEDQVHGDLRLADDARPSSSIRRWEQRSAPDEQRVVDRHTWFARSKGHMVADHGSVTAHCIGISF